MAAETNDPTNNPALGVANTLGAAVDGVPQPATEIETIDLEGLVRNIDQPLAEDLDAKPDVGLETQNVAPRASASSSTGGAPEAATPASEREPLHAEELSSDKIDEILMAEDPELAAQMEAIRSVGFAKTDGEIKSLEQEDEVASEALRGHSRMSFGERVRFLFLKIIRWMRAVKAFAKRAVTDFKGVMREVLIRSKVALIAWLRNRKASIGHGFGWLSSRTPAQKASLLFSVLVLAALVFIATATLRGTLLPKNEKLWIASFAEKADGIFTYDLNGAFEDFNDPLLHPEFVILIERVVVNLSRTVDASPSANPMAAFELYLQTDNQEAAVEIKDRNVEIRDAVARSVERMTYPDLVGEEGKAKLKLLIRKDLNEVISKGKVRRVFFKTIVLNPE